MQLQEVAELRSGSALKGAGSDAFYLQVRNVSSSAIRTDDLTPGLAPTRSLDDARLRVGDIVIALRGPTNVAAVVEDDTIAGRPLFGTLDLGIIRPVQGDALPAYVAAYLNLPHVQAALASRRVGRAAPRLPLGALAELDLPLPHLAKQRAVAQLAAEVAREERLQLQMIEARRRLIDRLLASSLEEVEEPVPGGHPARAMSAHGKRDATPEHVSTLPNGENQNGKVSR